MAKRVVEAKGGREEEGEGGEGEAEAEHDLKHAVQTGCLNLKMMFLLFLGATLGRCEKCRVVEKANKDGLVLGHWWERR